MDRHVEYPAPAFPLSVFNRLKLTLEMIRFSHSIFALPFALLATFMASGGWPQPVKLFWIVLACVFARSAAMTFNRLHDEPFDRLNPRTRAWHLPSGRLSRTFVWSFLGFCTIGFIFSAAMLNLLALALSPVALAILFGYSTAKRWTTGTHFVLGTALGIAPVGAWIAIRGAVDLPPLLLGLGVLFWVAGFDIIYSCQDEDFDRRIGLKSLPARFSRLGALRVSLASHVLSILFFWLTGWAGNLGMFYFSATAFVTALLAIEQAMVFRGSLGRLNTAFFTINGWVSILMFLGGAADIISGHGALAGGY